MLYRFDYIFTVKYWLVETLEWLPLHCEDTVEYRTVDCITTEWVGLFGLNWGVLNNDFMKKLHWYKLTVSCFSMDLEKIGVCCLPIISFNDYAIIGKQIRVKGRIRSCKFPRILPYSDDGLF